MGQNHFNLVRPYCFCVKIGNRYYVGGHLFFKERIPVDFMFGQRSDRPSPYLLCVFCSSSLFVSFLFFWCLFCLSVCLFICFFSCFLSSFASLSPAEAEDLMEEPENVDSADSTSVLPALAWHLGQKQGPTDALLQEAVGRLSRTRQSKSTCRC